MARALDLDDTRYYPPTGRGGSECGGVWAIQLGILGIGGHFWADRPIVTLALQIEAAI